MEKKIVAKRVSYPKAKRHWLQDMEGIYYSFWGSDVWGKDDDGNPRHGQLVQDEEYNITYETNDKGYHTITGIERLTYKQKEVAEEEEEEREHKLSGQHDTTPSEITGALIPITPTVNELVVKPQISPKDAIALWDEFQEFKKKLLDENDYVYYVEHGENKPKGFKYKAEADKFNEKQYRGEGKVVARIKKSGWRKFSQAFNLSIQIVKEIVLPSPPAPTQYAKYWVLITAPNGRTMPGIGVCSIHERGFAHQEHDIPATAMTRAVNRGVSDMIAAGEISAEEIGALNHIETAKDVADVIEKHFEEKKKLSDVVNGEVVGEDKPTKHVKVEKPKFTTTDPTSKERYEEIKVKVKEVADTYGVTQKSVAEDIVKRFGLNPGSRPILKRAEISNAKADDILEDLESKL